MPDTPESTRSDLAQLVAEPGSDIDDRSKNANKNAVTSLSAFNYVSSIVGSGIIGMQYCATGNNTKRIRNRSSISTCNDAVKTTLISNI